MGGSAARFLLMAAGLLLSIACTPRSRLAGPPGEPPPNIILILADDLGYGEVGCYGQDKIETPNIDRLASAGMRFTQFYSGSPVCAPSRCALLTGRHTGHAEIRDNREMGGWGRDATEGQHPLPHDAVTIAELLRDRGYATCAIGKWGLGGPASTGHPNRQGFDHWYGYLCQRLAHNYYPTHLWRNGDKDILAGNTYFAAHQRLNQPPDDPQLFERFEGRQYAPDLMIEEALQFIRRHQDKPFFLYFATPVPHAAIQVPQDALQQYLNRWDDLPYLGDKGYLPHPAPRAGYAAMVTRMDHDIGRIMDLIGQLGMDRRTLILFTSDNGPTFNGGTDSAFFKSSGPFRGLKCQMYEGGIRVPLIARWPGHIQAGNTTDHVSAFWDVLPTLAEVSGAAPPDGMDGISFLPTLLNRGRQQEHDYLYWEYRSGGGSQAVRMGRWKGVRHQTRRTHDASVELYDLRSDVGETRDLAGRRPGVVRHIRRIMGSARTNSEHFPLFKD